MNNYQIKAELVKAEYSYNLKLKNEIWIELINKLTLNELKIIFVILNKFSFMEHLEKKEINAQKFSREELNKLILKRYSLKELFEMIKSISKKISYIKLCENRFYLELKEIEVELINREKIINQESDYTILNSYLLFQERKKIEVIIYFYLMRYENLKIIFFNEKTLKDEFNIKKPFNRLNIEISESLELFKNAFGIEEIKKIYDKKRITKLLISKT